MYLTHGEEWTNTGEVVDNEDHMESYLGDGSCLPVNRSATKVLLIMCLSSQSGVDWISAEMPQTCEPHGGQEAVFRGADHQ